MAIHRVTLRWQGFMGGPGYTNLFFTGDGSGTAFEDSQDRAIDFINAIIGILPSDVEVHCEPEVVVLDEQTGMISGYHTTSRTITPSSGSGVGGYSAASGAVIHWMTAGVRNGRRVSGRTFLVPLAGGAYQNDGTLDSASLSALNDAGEALVGNAFESGFGVWSRPSNGSPGEFWECNGFRVPDMSAVLRSRRD